MGWLCGVGVFGLIECTHSLQILHCWLNFNNNNNNSIYLIFYFDLACTVINMTFVQETTTLAISRFSQYLYKKH